jgi:hypothetical protein
MQAAVALGSPPFAIVINPENQLQVEIMYGRGTTLRTDPNPIQTGHYHDIKVSSVQTVTFKNCGTGNLIFPVVAVLAGNFGWGPTTPTMCVPGTSYAPGASCTMAINFAPQSAGNLSGTLTVTDNASKSLRVIQLAGVGAVPGPIDTYSPTCLNCGSITVGQKSSVQAVTFKNTGGSNLIISAVALSGNFGWGPDTSTECSMNTPIAPGKSCTMAINFAPQSAGSQNGTLTITDNTSSTTKVIQLTGTGVAPAPAPTPAPAPVPAPSASTPGGLITNFTSARYNEFLIDGVSYDNLNVGTKSYSIREVDDHTLRFEIQQGDQVWCCGEESLLERVPMWNPGTPISVEYQFMLEPGAANTADWSVFYEMQSTCSTTVGCSPAFAIGLLPSWDWRATRSGENLYVEIQYTAPGGNPANGSPDLKYKILWTDPAKIVRGKWYDIKIQANVINTSAGYLKVWVDGVQVANYQGRVGFGLQNYMNYGLYRATAPQDLAAQYRNMTVSPR